MSENWLERTELLLGAAPVGLLAQKHVLVVGLGGVGAYAAEMLVRSGIGRLTIVDADVVEPTNKNRQLPALDSTLGLLKTEIMAKRLLDINPCLNLAVINEFLRDQPMIDLLEQGFDYVVDAIDTLSPKIHLIYFSLKNNLPIVSSMGSGGRVDPSKVEIADISKSYNDGLARILRKRLHRMGVYSGFQVVFSSEKVDKNAVIIQESTNKKSNVGTISYMPPIFGCFCASVVIRDLIKK